MLSFFNSYRFLRWWALCTRNVIKQMSCFPFMFPFILLPCSFRVDFMSYSFPLMFLSFCMCSFNVPSCSFHVLFTWHSCPFIFRRYASNIQVFERWYVQTGQVDIHQKGNKGSRLHHISPSFLLSCCYRFGGR